MPHEVDIHVGRKLKQARNLRRYSLADVARRLKLSFQQIQKYEIGSNRIAASHLYELSKILDVPTFYFFEGLAEETINPADNALDIMSAVASIKDEQLQLRIITFIPDVAGTTTARMA